MAAWAGRAEPDSLSGIAGAKGAVPAVADGSGGGPSRGSAVVLGPAGAEGERRARVLRVPNASAGQPGQPS